MDDSIHHILALGASHAPDAVALRTSDGKVWRYRTLLGLAEALAAEIVRRGVDPGGRVAVVCENGAAGVVALFAASLAGCIVIPVNARLTSAEIDHIEREASPGLWIYTSGESQAAGVHAASAGTSSLYLPPLPALGLRQAVPEAVEPAAPGTALILFTSGTTGCPKGVMHSASAVNSVAASERAYRDIRQSDHIFCPLPLAHMFGLTSLLMPYLSGGACVELVGRFDAQAVLARLSAGEITHFFGVPSIYSALLAAAESSGLRPRGLIAARTGGASIDPTLAERAGALFGVPLANGYGATEISPICTTREAGSGVGGPAAGAEICLMDASGSSVRAGSEGEIWARGPHRMLGYYNADEATAAALRPGGWYATGDLGRLDESGNLHIVGRIKDVINRSGFNVYPAEVEMALSRHPKVARCAVIGAPSSNEGEEVVAIVEPCGVLTASELADHARTQLAGYKRPARYLFVDALPIGATGKIVKAALVALANDASAID
jgi:acyl-CoA synthetase (AMP-forming)/AMP-acid ligase II